MFEGIPTAPQETDENEPLYDSRLEDLWDEYDFAGHPPKKGTTAEKRLFEKCSLYATYIDGEGHKDARANQISDSQRRVLHNEIAIMLVGQKRSGMKSKDAEHIADFAYEYARGVTLAESKRLREENGR